MAFVQSSSVSLRQHQRSFWQQLGHWAVVQRERRHLSRLDDEALADIGLSRKDAQTEANRGFWDAPVNWRQ